MKNRTFEAIVSGGAVLALLLGCSAWGAPQQGARSAAQRALAAPTQSKAKAAGVQETAPGSSSLTPTAAASEDHGKERDPFHTLIPEKKASEPSAGPIRLPVGKKGLVIEQLILQGIARAVDGSWIAVVDNKTKRAYFLREHDQLYNGVVSSITPNRVVFMETGPGTAGQTASREVVRQLSSE